MVRTSPRISGSGVRLAVLVPRRQCVLFHGGTDPISIARSAKAMAPVCDRAAPTNRSWWTNTASRTSETSASSASSRPAQAVGSPRAARARPGQGDAASTPCPAGRVAVFPPRRSPGRGKLQRLPPGAAPWCAVPFRASGRVPSMSRRSSGSAPVRHGGDRHAGAEPRTPPRRLDGHLAAPDGRSARRVALRRHLLIAAALSCVPAVTRAQPAWPAYPVRLLLPDAPGSQGLRMRSLW